MIAVEIRNHDCVKLLLANGADVNAANTVGTKWRKRGRECFWVPMYCSLANACLSLQIGRTPLHAAISTKGMSLDLVLALLLIEAGAEVDLKDKVSPDNPW